MQKVGEILRAEREKQGISFKDVEKATSIRALYIQAIEEENYKIMPGEVYLKGFIRNYANFLGLNGQEMVDLYRQNLSPEPIVESEPKKTEIKKRSANKSTGKKGPLVIAVLAVLAIIWLVWYFFINSPTNPQPQTPSQSGISSVPTPQAPPPSPTPTTPTPAPITPAPTTPAPVKPDQLPANQQAANTAAEKTVVIAAKYTGTSWTSVTADGKIIYEGTPKAGDSFSWSAAKNLSIKLGNAAAVDVTFNGQPQPKLGGAGEVIVKTFSTNPSLVKKP